MSPSPRSLDGRVPALTLAAGLVLAMTGWGDAPMGLPITAGAYAQDQEDPALQEAEPKMRRPSPPELPKPTPAPTLKTIPVKRGALGFNEIAVDSTRLPRDRQGIWILDFVFKPVRIRTIEVPGRGRKQIYYLWYRVVNRTGEPRLFVPQFSLVTNTGKRYDDVTIPQAIPVIQAREEGIPLLGAVSIMGLIPPSTREEIDDAVYGVALFENVDPRATSFKIYVRGLSDGYQVIPGDPNATDPKGTREIVKYKTLRIDFTKLGDEFLINEKEIQLQDPPYEWIYW